jgi:hypothetical protein
MKRFALVRNPHSGISTVSLARYVDMIANIEGTVMDIRCSVPGCGEVRTWWMGEESVEMFLEKLKKDKVSQLTKNH